MASDADELQQLRDENTALRAQLDRPSEAQRRSRGFRSVTSWILVVLAAFTVVAGVHAVWLQTTIVDEDRFVATFAPLPKDPAVSAALSERLADELMVAGGVASAVDESLPEELAFLAVPITEGFRTVTAEVADGVIRSDEFSGIWRFVLRASHNAASLVLSTNGKIAIDLNNAADEVVAALEGQGIDILSGQDIELPEIVLFQNEQLQAAAEALNIIETLGWALPFLALALIALAMWVSPNRRRTAAALGFGTAIATLASLAVVRVFQSSTVSNIDNETQRAAAEAVWDTTLRFYRQSMWAVLILASIAGISAWIAGPSSRAARARAWWHRTLDRWQGPDATIPTSGVAGFIAAWKRPIQWAAVILGLLVVVLGPPTSVWAVLATALIVLVAVAIVEVVGGPAPAEE